jgi:hypothetical protein
MINQHQLERNSWAPCWRRRSASRVHPHRFWRVFIFLTLACLSFLNTHSNVIAQNEGSAEYPIKLAFLYNFTKFVEWPPESFPEPSAPLAICIVGRDPFSADLETELRSRKVGDHPVDVRSLRATDAVNACHIVFVPVTEKDHADKIMKDLQGSNTLTVGESEGFAELGGIINLVIEGNKLHFEVNQAAADRARVKISSKLLMMAKIVKERRH